MSHFRVHMKLEIREYDDRAAIVSGSEVACLGSCLGPMTRNHAEVFADEVLSQFKRLEAENPEAQRAEAAIRRAFRAATTFALIALLLPACASEGATIPAGDAEDATVVLGPPARGPAGTEQGADQDAEQATTPDAGSQEVASDAHRADTAPEASQPDSGTIPDQRQNGPDTAPDTRPIIHDPNCADTPPPKGGFTSILDCADWPHYGLCSGASLHSIYCNLTCGVCTL